MITQLLPMLLATGCTPMFEDTAPPYNINGSRTDVGDFVGIGVQPQEPVIEVGGVLAFRANAYYNTDNYRDATTEVTWMSGDDRVVTIDQYGVARGVSQGETLIEATHQSGVSARTQLTVVGNGAEVAKVDFAPQSIKMETGDVVEMIALATYDDDSQGNIAASCAWTTLDATIVTVTAGTVEGVGPGKTLVQAACSGFETQIDVEVVGEIVEGAVDLSVSTFTAEVLGSTIRYSVTVANTGSRAADGFYVNTYLHRDSPPVDLTDAYDGWAWVPGVAGGATASALIDVDSVAVGSYSSWAFVDPDSFVEESDDGNNVAGPLEVGGAEQADLVIQTLDAVVSGSTTQYTVTIKNEGGTGANDFWLDLFTDAYAEPNICDYGDVYWTVKYLEPGGTLTFEAEVAEVPDYWWDSYAFVDSCDDVTESAENNNISTARAEP